MIDRRTFLKISTLVTLGAAGGRELAAGLEAIDPAALPAAGAAGAAKRWALVIDVAKCLETPDCDRCIAACNRGHNVPRIDDDRHEVKWIWKEPFEQAFPDQENPWLDDKLKSAPVLTLCNHCDNPPCVRVCPTKATFRRPDGIVDMDLHRCIGCRYCMVACPYGSRSFNWMNPRPHIPRIDPEYPTRTKGVVEKCTFCVERLDKGQAPLCAAACPAGALVFGDLSDDTSEVRKRLKSRFALQRKAALGTKPMVFYLI
ncbi:MAG: 4Fe-4S dicluster domain-containing protein [bacterium]|nr:4Fe-4S dicluster domain-containing protein [bacterium]